MLPHLCDLALKLVPQTELTASLTETNAMLSLSYLPNSDLTTTPGNA